MQIQVLDLRFLDLEHAIAAFLVEGPQGYVLVETGPHSGFPRLQSELAARGVALSDVKHALLSHIHFDHAGAAWALAEQGAQIYVHPKGLPHLAAPEKLYNSARQIYGDQMDRLWGAMHPIPEAQLHAPDHGAVLEMAGLRCTAWYTPGHAVHHIAWQVDDGAESVLFTGDVAGVKIDNGPVAPPCPPPDIHVEDWLNSIQLMRDLPVEILYLTHFGIIKDKKAHLDALQAVLLDWANWMKPHVEAGAAAENVVPLFIEHVASNLRAQGVQDAGIRQYEAANPAFMSVAGLMRYWKKQGVGPN